MRMQAIDPIWGGAPSVFVTTLCLEYDFESTRLFGCVECYGYGPGELNGIPIFGLHFPTCSYVDPATIQQPVLAVRRYGYGWPGGAMTLEHRTTP